MGWFSKNSQAPKNSFPWKSITSLDELNAALNGSVQKPALFFKHSTRCNISSMALNRLENSRAIDFEDLEVYFIDLIAHREISNALAEKTGVTHQSPQAIVLKNNEVVYHASHGSIDAKQIMESIH